MLDDRRVHGTTENGGEVVRYDRAGKWYLEHPGDPRKRVQVPFSEAVRIALLPGSTAILRVPGGSRFDAAVHKICGADQSYQPPDQGYEAVASTRKDES